MLNIDDPLDFESEDPLASTPAITQKSRKKVIGLDDLLTDYYKEKSKVIERESKRAKSRKYYNSDEDDCGKEALLSRKINECQNQMRKMSAEEEISTWGVQVFGNEKTPPPLVFPELQSCSFLHSFMSNKLNSLVELTTEKGETFLAGLLVNGWLSKLVIRHGHVEESLAKWTFNLILYSSKEELRTSAHDFWCSILLPGNKVDKMPTRVEWSPSYSELKRALETYGFLFDFSSQTKSGNTDFSRRGPPENIRGWIKFADACCLVRSKQPIFSASDAEELVKVIIYLSLDRQLQGLLVLLYGCMQSAINYFTDEEWTTSCEEIARAIACRVPRDLNCLRALECISGVGTRSNHLRSAVAYQILLVCFDNKAADEEGILNLLMSINVKDKICDFFKMYIYLVLTENWLLSNPILEYKPVIYEMWGVYLRNCSSQITSTDLRPYASKVRTKASYLLHSSTRR
ncbi:uncharacterized protein LOC8275232 isoform X1 [Ricinus communis]|uniref:uncharacterized protein LOC8275232 isoform X1 n=1 Tax=Ricinus communis TaxID=3988 RepID=UPI00201AB722|nr:uncharacterized protein LOC8275232 isoform X1 [Ricinus communis]XP_015577598.2 uncharacterized protein LOC8275232 isoform X1 [Ricinus communis]XP_048234016.1 uncharacterized protein LOC8275232 isoform X1 [Ricinus communis]XP_048234017.1 uncharacterized protein LOC8275232 isoform X1 [Ricinus communis]